MSISIKELMEEGKNAFVYAFLILLAFLVFMILFSLVMGVRCDIPIEGLACPSCNYLC